MRLMDVVTMYFYESLDAYIYIYVQVPNGLEIFVINVHDTRNMYSIELQNRYMI